MEASISLPALPAVLAWPVAAFAGMLCLYVLGWAVYNRLFHPYRDVPGPFLASLSSWWLCFSIRFSISANVQREIHDKYGDVVRLAPNLVSIRDPQAIDVIYTRATFTKTALYDSFDPKISKHRDTFTERDESHHAVRRRLTSRLYSSANVATHADGLNRVTELLCRRLLAFADAKVVFDLSLWLKKYAFDVIGEMFYGLPGGFGFLARDVDYNHWCLLMDHMPPVVASMAYVPRGFLWLYMLLQCGSPRTLIGLWGHHRVIAQATQAAQDRMMAMRQPDWKPRADNLQMLMDIMAEQQGQKYDFNVADVATELWMMIWGGSDTTATAQAAVFFFLNQHPCAMRRLVAELDAAWGSKILTAPVLYRDAVTLPYLKAVINEALRLHPPIGVGMPRRVPDGGAQIAGRFYPAGGEVLVNPAVVHRNRTVFGDDADDFRPERWLDPARATTMHHHLITFGKGPRMCQGQRIAEHELYVLIPTVLRDVTFEYCTPEWKNGGLWFQHPKGLAVRLRRRHDHPKVEAAA